MGKHLTLDQRITIQVELERNTPIKAIARKIGKGRARCRVFYCDPLHTNQKSQCERNHEYIRCVLPQGLELRRADAGRRGPGPLAREQLRAAGPGQPPPRRRRFRRLNPGPRPPPRSPPSHGASVQGIVTGLTFSPRKMRPSMSTIAVAIASTSASIQTAGSETNFSTPRLR